MSTPERDPMTPLAIVRVALRNRVIAESSPFFSICSGRRSSSAGGRVARLACASESATWSPTRRHIATARRPAVERAEAASAETLRCLLTRDRTVGSSVAKCR